MICRKRSNLGNCTQWLPVCWLSIWSSWSSGRCLIRCSVNSNRFRSRIPSRWSTTSRSGRSWSTAKASTIRCGSVSLWTRRTGARALCLRILLHTFYFLGLIYGFKGLILVFGLFLAYETRSIKVKQINDSRYVGMSIYNVVVLCLITAPVAMVIASQQDASFVFISLAVIFCCFLSMLLIFVPKVNGSRCDISESFFQRNFSYALCF